MSRTRFAVVAIVLVLFVVIGGIVIFATSHRGGQTDVYNVTVTGASMMAPSTLNAHVNDTVTINIKSDTDGEVHLHVYDIPFDTMAGQTVSHTFTADKTCTCLIEWESTSTPLGNLVVSP